MTTPIMTLVYSAIIGLIAGIAFIPLSRFIPIQLEKHWQTLINEEHERQQIPADQSKYSLSASEKIVLPVLAIAITTLPVYLHGLSLSGSLISLYFLAMLLLFAINMKRQLLPDIIVIPTLWIGLLSHAWTGDASNYVFGSSVAYMIPYALLLLSKRQLFGNGDLKCFAMAGAWFGMQSLTTLFLVFTVVVIVHTIIRSFVYPDDHQSMPTGLAHLIASLAIIYNQSGM